MKRLTAALLLGASTALTTPAFAFTSGNIVTYSDNTGAHVQDSGVAASAVVTTNSAAVLGSVTVGTDQFSGAFGSLLGMFAGSGGNNVFVGELVNNAAASSSVLPVAVSGACKVTTNSNICFGLYGLGEARWGGTGGVVLGGEVTVRNFTTNNPDTNLPPNTGFGTTTSVLNGWQVTCGAGGGETHDCSIGVIIGSESGLYSTPIFNTGIYAELYRQYGMVIEAQTSGNQIGAWFKGNGNGNVLFLQTTAEPVAANTVLTIQNHSNQNLFAVREDANLLAGTSGTVSVSCSANSVSLTTLVVTDGIVTHC